MVLTTESFKKPHNHLTRDIKPQGQCPKCDEEREKRHQAARERAAEEIQ